MLIKLGTMSTPPVKPTLGPGGTQRLLGPGGTQNPTLGPGGTQRPTLGPGGTQRLPAQFGFELNTQYATIVMMVYRLLILIMILAGLFTFGTAPRPSGLVPDALKPFVRGGGKSTRG